VIGRRCNGAFAVAFGALVAVVAAFGCNSIFGIRTLDDPSASDGSPGDLTLGDGNPDSANDSLEEESVDGGPDAVSDAPASCLDGTACVPIVIKCRNGLFDCSQNTCVPTTRAADGVPCGDAGICSSGSCIAACYIGGSILDSGTVNLTGGVGSCQVCNPAVDTMNWSPGDGFPCTGNGECSNGACISTVWANWIMPNSNVDVEAGAPNPESFTNNGDGTVTDNVTGLMWQQSETAATYSWDQADSYCTWLSLGGHSDWRLPNLIELVSIMDYSFNPAINTSFFSGSVTAWSSTPGVCGGNVPCIYAMNTMGNLGLESATVNNGVWCVR